MSAITVRTSIRGAACDTKATAVCASSNAAARLAGVACCQMTMRASSSSIRSASLGSVANSAVMRSRRWSELSVVSVRANKARAAWRSMLGARRCANCCARCQSTTASSRWPWRSSSSARATEISAARIRNRSDSALWPLVVLCAVLSANSQSISIAASYSRAAWAPPSSLGPVSGCVDISASNACAWAAISLFPMAMRRNAVRASTWRPVA